MMLNLYHNTTKRFKPFFFPTLGPPTGVHKRWGGDSSPRRQGNQSSISACRDARVYNGCPVSSFQQHMQEGTRSSGRSVATNFVLLPQKKKSPTRFSLWDTGQFFRLHHLS